MAMVEIYAYVILHFSQIDLDAVCSLSILTNAVTCRKNAIKYLTFPLFEIIPKILSFFKLYSIARLDGPGNVCV